MSVQCMCTSLVMLFMHCIRIHRAKIFIQVYYLYGAKIPCNNKPKKMQSFFLNWSGIHLKSLFLDTACFCLSLSMQNYASHFICFWHPHTNTYMFVHFAYVKPKKTDFFRAPTCLQICFLRKMYAKMESCGRFT